MRVKQNHESRRDARVPSDDGRLDDRQADGKERPWRLNRLRSIGLADAYALLPGLEGYGERIRACTPWLKFADYSNGMTVLAEAFFCKVRLCAMCSWRKSRMLHLQICEIVANHWKRRPSDRALLLTLTQTSVEAADLKAELRAITKGLNRFTDYAKFNEVVTGWYRTLEITRNRETGMWHPHVHLLLMVRGDYFDKKKSHYIPQAEWQTMWQRAMKLDYAPVVDVRSVKGGVAGDDKLNREATKALHEVTKYVSKPSDLYKITPDGIAIEPGIVKTLHNALHKTRLTGFGGTFKEIRADLKQQDPDDPNADLVRYEKAEIPPGTEMVALRMFQWVGVGVTSRPDYYLRDVTAAHGRDEQRAA